MKYKAQFIMYYQKPNIDAKHKYSYVAAFRYIVFNTSEYIELYQSYSPDFFNAEHMLRYLVMRWIYVKYGATLAMEHGIRLTEDKYTLQQRDARFSRLRR